MHKRIFIVMMTFIFLSACSSMSYQQKSHTSKAHKSAVTNAQLGVAYLKQGNMVRAKEKLNKALSQGDDLPVVQYSMGYFYEQTGESQKAERAYQRAIGLDRNSGEGHNNYGAFLCRQQRYQEAEKEFILAVEDPQYTGTAKAYENAGLCSLENTDYVAAENYFKLALKHQPNLSSSLIELADLQYTKGNLKPALTHLQLYQQIGKTSPRALLLGVQINEKLGNKINSRRYASLLKKKFPRSPESDQLSEYSYQ